MSITLLVRRGDTWRRRFLWKQNDVALDLSLASANFEIRYPHNKELVATGTTSIIPALGAVDVYVDNTENIAPGNYTGILKLTFIDGTTQSTPPMLITVEDEVNNLTGGIIYVRD